MPNVVKKKKYLTGYFDEKVFFVPDAAELFGVTPAMVYNWINSGKLTSNKYLGLTYFKQVNFDLFIERELDNDN